MKKIVIITLLNGLLLVLAACGYLYYEDIPHDDNSSARSASESMNESLAYISDEHISGDLPSELTDDSHDFIGYTMTLIEYSPHFRIYHIPEPMMFHYEIYNYRGELVKSFTTCRPAWVEYINETVIEIGIGAGTGVQIVQFYSVNDDVFSDVFETPFLINDETVAYLARYDDMLMLIVQNIFDPASFYMAFPLDDFDFAEIPHSAIDIFYFMEFTLDDFIDQAN